MKKVVSIFCPFALVLLITMLCTTATHDIDNDSSSVKNSFQNEVQEQTEKNIHAGDPANIEGFESFNQRDYDSNFVNYANMEATVVLPMPLDEDGEISNVVGTVFCKETNEVIANAVVSVGTTDDGEIVSVTTDNSGRFHILGLPGGFYSWTLSSEDYYDAQYIGYDVCEGTTTIFTFYMSEHEVLERESFYYQELYSNDEVAVDSDRSMDVEIEERAHTVFSFSRVPTLSSFTVGVGANSAGNGGTATTVSRSSYLAHVVPNEAIGSWICKNTYSMTDSQIKQYYAAQAVAACSFIEWAVHGDAKHSAYTVCDTSNCQKYDPTSTNVYAVEALALIYDTVSGNAYFTIMLYKPTSRTYDYIYPAYFLHCTGNTKTHSTRPELQSVSCTDIDGTHSSYAGNGWRLCQKGAAQKAKEGDTYIEILQYYYTNVAVVVAFE